MAGWKFSVKGAREAKKSLEEIADEVKGGPVTPDTLFKIAEATKNLASSRTPVRTGFLKSRNQTEQISRKEIRIFNDAPYAGYVNFGTSKMVARPFFTSAIRYAKDEFPQVFSEAMKKKIGDIVRSNKPGG